MAKFLQREESRITSKRKDIIVIMRDEIYWYELCFYGDEDEDTRDSEKACSYVIKTEIPPVIDDDTALQILFGKNPSNEEKALMENCTCIMNISEDEAQFFDIEDLTNRVEAEFGVYYTR